MEPPVVEPFATEELVDGLEVLHCAADPDDGTVVLTLSHAWRARSTSPGVSPAGDGDDVWRAGGRS